MIEPLIRTIDVPCSAQMAFEVFLDDMSSWWPLDKFTVSAMSGSPAKGLRVESRVGGAIVEIGPDDTEHLWGTIKSYDPFNSFSMDFHIPRPGEVVTDRSCSPRSATRERGSSSPRPTGRRLAPWRRRFEAGTAVAGTQSSARPTRSPAEDDPVRTMVWAKMRTAACLARP